MKTRLSLALGSFVLLSTVAVAQGPGSKSPVVVDRASDVIRHITRDKLFSLPSEANAAIHTFRTRTVPYWGFSFGYQGITYDEVAIGKSIFSNGGTAAVNVAIVPVKFRFPAYTDPDTGQPLEIDATNDVSNVLLSPNFSSSQYATGYTQYQDAAQRASFYGYYANSWHTLLTPRVLRTVTIDVPADKGYVYQVAGTGTPFALLDYSWFLEQQTLVDAQSHISVEQLPIFLTHNVGVYFNGDPNDCCDLSWHGAYFTQVLNDTYFIQTHVWGGWFAPDVIGPEFADVYALTHEIAEWMNDPFGVNFVPRWDFPQGPDFYYVAGACKSARETYLMEVADPLQTYSFSYHIQSNDFDYHVANQALVSWFTRDVPSSAIHGAYSFPDETILTAPSPACP